MHEVVTIIGEERAPEPVRKGILLRRSRNAPFYFIEGKLQKGLQMGIDEQTSFYVDQYERTEKFQAGLWDGKEHLLYKTRSTGDYYFPVGLLPEVCGILDDFEIDYTIEEVENRKAIPISIKWVSEKKLWPDQEDAVAAVIEAGGGTVCMPTGSGKTVAALAIMAKVKLKTLIVVRRKELLKQWKLAIEEALGVTPGLVGAGKTEWGDITVAMVQTLYRQKKIPIPQFDMLILDECHMLPSRSAYQLALKCNAVFRMGLSATPVRADHAEMKIFAAVGSIVYTSRADVLVDKERIAEPNFLFLPTSYPPGIHRGMEFHKVYTLGISANADRNRRIVEIANKLLSEGHIVYVHVEELAHGKWLAGHIPGAEFVCGEDGKKKRDDIISRFSSGKLKICVSTLLGEGVDLPKISALIMAGGRKTEAGTIQKIGRALRITKTKRSAIIVDFMDKGVYLSDHWQLRYKAYKKYYGDLCPNLTMR